jgi:hypothetical protein
MSYVACRALIYVVHNESLNFLRSNPDVAISVRDILSKRGSKRPACQVSHRGLLQLALC